jgi:PQQ-dependent dehydrogenase (methanol/ethanol family)
VELSRRWTAVVLFAAACPLGVNEAAAQALVDQAGRKTYEARCAGCHGADGEGGGHGPGFVGIRQPRARTRAELRDLIRKGIPDAGMPAFDLTDAELDALAAYTEALRAPAADRPVAGNSDAGEGFFKGKGGCASCHMIRGRGGIFGPDLSNLARERRLVQIERVFGSSSNVLPASPPRRVSIRLREGRRVQGIARYESPFDVGVQTIDGRFLSLRRASIAELTIDPPLAAHTRVPADEAQNLLAFLTRLTIDRAPRATFTGSDEIAHAGPLPFDDIARPRPGEWPTYNGHVSGNRHSPLREIDASNVARLSPRWMFPVPSAQGALQVTPVVVDGLMYVTAVNAVFALDARTGRQVWQYSRPRTQGLVGDPAAGINRGVAVAGDRVFFQTDHAHVVALHRIGGQVLWDVEMADYRDHYGATGAPLVVNDLVIAGVSGGDEGNRGFLDAYRASTGERAWRVWTVPARGEPGSETWIGKALEHGCATTWLTGTYDPAARLIYWPTGNPCPDYNGDERMGDNLYSNSVLALDADTGKLRWHFQFTPHDLHDWDANQTPVLVDVDFRGRPRKLLLQGNRNGFFYVLDRLTGELLLAEPFVNNLTWASGVGKDGRPVLLPGNEPAPAGTRTCPSVTGATNWPSTSFNPATRLFYLMAEESCGIYTKNSEWWVRGESFYGGTTRRAPGEINRKFVRAIDVESGRIAWQISDLGGGILSSGLMSTAGGLVFYGDAPGGAFVAADAKTGAPLWHFNTGQSWKAGPMTYAIDGKQYVAIAAGSTIVVFALP